MASVDSENEIRDPLTSVSSILEQLQSFLSALMLPVDLTQGPPGTGKSYLGVVLVRALLIMRKLWINLCPEVGKKIHF
jgi:hypothetical protein